MNLAQAWSARFHALRATVAQRELDQNAAQTELNEHVNNRPRFVAGPILAQVENTGRIGIKGLEAAQVDAFFQWLDEQRAEVAREQELAEQAAERARLGLRRRVNLEGPDDPDDAV